MNIQPIVEGHGEVSAVPVLLRRFANLAQAFALDINAPIRRKRSELVQETGLRRSIQLARFNQTVDPSSSCSTVIRTAREK